MADSFNVEKNTFYKTKEIDSDTSIKSYYPDSFDGKAINGDISNDANQIIYLANSKAPSIPMETVDPEIKSLHLQYYTNNVSSSNAQALPRFKVYKMKDSAVVTEGKLPIIDDSVTSFYTHQGGESPWMEDTFSGVNTGFADRVDYTKGVAMNLPSTKYKISGKQYKKYLEFRGYFSLDKGGPLREAPHDSTTIILQQQPGGRYGIVKVNDREIGPYDIYRWAPNNSENYEKWVFAGYTLSESQLIEYGAYKDESLFNREIKTYSTFDTEFTDRVTQFNTIFNFVKEAPDSEDIKVQTIGTTGDDNKMYSTSRFMFNNGDKLTGNASGHIEQFWENYTGTDTNYANFFGRTYISGTSLPQTTFASIDFFPQPVDLDFAGYGAFDEVNAAGNAKELEFTLKFEEQPFVTKTLNKNESDVGPMLRYYRGFFIVFSQIAPKKDDNWNTFLGRNLHRIGAPNHNPSVSGTMAGMWFVQDRPDTGYSVVQEDYVYGIPFTNDTKGGYPGITGAHWGDDDDIHSNFDRLRTGSAAHSPPWNIKVPLNEWFKLRFKFQYHRPKGEPYENILVYTPDVFDDTGEMQSGTLMLSNFINEFGSLWDINCVSIWANNFRAIAADMAYTGGINPNCTADPPGFETDDFKQSVLIDSIKFTNIGSNVNNATINNNNILPAQLGMSYETGVPAWNYGGASGNNWPQSVSQSMTGGQDNFYGELKQPIQQNWCFGFDDDYQDYLQGNGMSFFFNGFNSATSNLLGIHEQFISGSYSYSGGVGITAQKVGAYKGGTRFSGKDRDVDDFVQQGFASISGTYADLMKRENIYCAARVIGASTNGKTIMVDAPEVFDLPLGPPSNGGTEYVMWFMDDPKTFNVKGTQNEASNYTDFIAGSSSCGMIDDHEVYQTKRRDGNTIYLNRDLTYSDAGNNSMVTTHISGAQVNNYTHKGQNRGRLGSVFISPKKYWFNFHFIPTQRETGYITTWGSWNGASAGANGWGGIPITNRSYESVLLVSGTTHGSLEVGSADTVLGSTFNEYLWTDGGNSKEWRITNDGQGIIDTNIDYGFSTYGTADTTNDITYGGYINESFPLAGKNYLDLSSYIKVSNPDYDSNFNFTLYPFLEDNQAYTNTYRINIDNREGSNPPKLIWGIRDSLPRVSELTVAPAVDVLSMENPLSESSSDFSDVTFTWKEDAPDVWYRLLFVDTALIENKYTNANFIASFNENPDTDSSYSYYSGSADYATKSNGRTITGGTPSSLASIEGIQGYGLSGAAYLHTEGVVETLGAADQFSLLTHLKPITTGTILRASSSTANNNSLILQLNSSKKLVAKMNNAATTLTSTTAFDVDGEQPLSVLLTYNKASDANNFKMYVNGTLEDTSNYTTDFSNTSLVQYFRYDAGETDVYSGWLEELTWYTKEIYNVPNASEYQLNTSLLTDEVGGQSNAYNSRLFVFDYHNIRGVSPASVARSNSAGWKVTSL
tara:strand:+ start:8447 stop:12838 length:4392 start_codon:yes stop_codon:yes gene_type:complete